MDVEQYSNGEGNSSDNSLDSPGGGGLALGFSKSPNGKSPESPTMMKSPQTPIISSTERIKRRAKRLTQRQNSRESAVNGSGGGNGIGGGGGSIGIGGGSGIGGNGANGPTTTANGTVIHLVNGGIVNSGSYFAPQRRWKNSRRSRNGHGRGLPKKGGAGGKGVWGKIGSELLVEEEDIEDKNDPNYDSEVNDKNTQLCEVIPEPTPEEFFKQFEPIMLEYFENGDTHEVALSLDEIIVGATLRQLVTLVAVEISMDHKDSHREMTSLLISDLYGRVITPKDISKGFDMLLNNLPDLILDTPEAPTWLGNFIARAIADDCIPPIYVLGHEGLDNLNEHAITAIKRAEVLLSLKTTMVHLDNIWGSAGPLRPVKTITKQMTSLLKEYLVSRDLAEAQRCIRALEVPHYHHELVYEAIVMALEGVNQQTEEAMCLLVKSLDETCMVSPAMMEQGFQRVFDDMTDIVLDVPLAYIMLDRFVERCSHGGFLSDKVVRNMPTRGRKRFVSEGDGGHIKPQTYAY